MDRVNGCFETITISSLAKRWSQLSLFEKVYANSQLPEKVGDTKTSKGTSEDGAEEKDKAKDSDEYFRKRLEDPKLKALVEMDVKEHMIKETGLDRVKEMYAWKPDHTSPEMYLVTRTAINTGTMLFIVGAVLGGNAAADTFRSKNKHTAFATPFIAARKYNDVVMFGSIRLGLKFAFSAGSLAGLFVLSSQTMAVYRNKSSLWEYIAGGGIACSLIRLVHGWRNMVVGGVLGSFFGLVGGAAIFGFLKVTNMTQEQRHYKQLVEHFVNQREFEDPPQSATISVTDGVVA